MAERIKQKKKLEYLREANRFFKVGDVRSALKTLRAGLAEYPADPFLLSYCGLLLCLADGDYAGGINLCREAVGRLRDSMPFGVDTYLPVLYLNLGRAYLSAGDKQEALTTFRRGLSVDPKNRDLADEVRRLGIRKEPPLGFLGRENVLNKYIGLLFRKRSRVGIEV